MPKNSKIISYTRVSADIFHYGHLKLFDQAKSVADYHICGLYTDELCLQWNGSLVMKYNEREAIINQLYLIDEIIEQKNIDPTENLKLIYNKYPDSKIILFQGHQNWVGLPGTDFVRSIGGEIIKPDYYPGFSRNKIKEKLQNTTGNNINDIDNYILGNISFFPFINSTKANTLASLKKQKLQHSLIENLFVFTALQWTEERKRILKTVQNYFDGKIIVRSSSKVEDGLTSSYAGYFHSELNVDSGDKKAVKNAIELVINSYAKHDETSNDDQILVQSQTKDILYSGVVFTREFQKNSPYYLINYDKSKNTDSVTSGKIGNKIEIIKNITSKDLPSPWSKLITSVKEIEGRLHNLALDIEYGIKNNNKVVIFQVRPIAANQKYSNNIDDNIYKAVQDIINKYKRLSNKSISSSSYTLSDMSFWNPAEIIGERSNTLAYSSYRYLILHRAWNIGLVPLGYKKIESDLIVRLGNKSYIEVETAFTALLPRKLKKSIVEKLVSFYINKLKSNPELHDKVEFEIVHNCYTPMTEDQLLELKPILNGQEYKQFKESLKNLTQNIFRDYNSIKMKDLSSLEELEKRRNQIIQKNHNISLINKIILAGNLIEDAREFGTPQFSRMARLAFIGNQYLKALVKKNVITEQDSDIYLTNIDTIASELKKDFDSVLKNKLTIDEFKSIYGHLRPGTYDINKIPYDKDNSYFSVDANSAGLETINQNLPKGNLKKFRNSIKKYLSTYELDLSVEELLCFIEETTKFREKFKFEFTKNLSIAYELLFEVGLELGLNRDSLSHLSIESILAINPRNNIEDILDYWTTQVSGKKKIDNIFNHIALPSLVFNHQDFNLVQYRTARPNYITTLVVRSNLIDLDKLEQENYGKVSGKVVLLENADPGYDWIFSKNINGLITRFGGVASHMAIRCAEFKIPAAIGCGEVIYKELQLKTVIELNCKEKSIRYIK